jgi:hypothetical protein
MHLELLTEQYGRIRSVSGPVQNSDPGLQILIFYLLCTVYIHVVIISICCILSQIYALFIKFYYALFLFFKDMHYNTMIRTFCILKKMTFSDFHYLTLSIRFNKNKGLGAIRAKIGPTSDVDKMFSKVYSQYVLFRNKYRTINTLPS